jgi:hypothetical protein
MAFRTLRLAVDGTTREGPWDTVARVEVLERTVSGSTSPTMHVERKRGADRLVDPVDEALKPGP